MISRRQTRFLFPFRKLRQALLSTSCCAMRWVNRISCGCQANFPCQQYSCPFRPSFWSLISSTHPYTGLCTLKLFMDSFTNIIIHKRRPVAQMMTLSMFIPSNTFWENTITCGLPICAVESLVFGFMYWGRSCSWPLEAFWRDGIIRATILWRLYLDTQSMIPRHTTCIIGFLKATMDNILCSGIMSLEPIGTCDSESIILAQVKVVSNVFLSRQRVRSQRPRQSKSTAGSQDGQVRGIYGSPKERIAVVIEVLFPRYTVVKCYSLAWAGRLP